jgi:hypothetical protein
MEQKLEPGLSSAFPFSDDIFLPAAPMTDEEFAKFVIPKNDEIPIERVDFSNAMQP